MSLLAQELGVYWENGVTSVSNTPWLGWVKLRHRATREDVLREKNSGVSWGVRMGDIRCTGCGAGRKQLLAQPHRGASWICSGSSVWSAPWALREHQSIFLRKETW